MSLLRPRRQLRQRPRQFTGRQPAPPVDRFEATLTPAPAAPANQPPEMPAIQREPARPQPTSNLESRAEPAAPVAPAVVQRSPLPERRADEPLVLRQPPAAEP